MPSFMYLYSKPSVASKPLNLKATDGTFSRLLFKKEQPKTPKAQVNLSCVPVDTCGHIFSVLLVASSDLAALGLLLEHTLRHVSVEQASVPCLRLFAFSLALACSLP